jgi:hypothetical protein
MRRFALTLTLLLIPSVSTSQEIREFSPDPAAGSAAAPSALAAQTGSQDLANDRSTLRYVLTAAGGAAVGAWVGYMASQVAVGDWEDQHGIQRSNWAAGGAIAGLTLGLTLPISVGGPGQGTALGRTSRDERAVLTGEVIRETGASSVYDAIQSLRPEWLRTRGTGSMRETPTGTAGLNDEGRIEMDIQPGIPTIRVYLDESLLGDVDQLRLVSPGMVGDVRFLTAAEATQRWGGGHIHGAIHVRTVVN